MSELENILIIKHGALGDVILATGPIAAIRKANPVANICVLTTPAFKTVFEQCPHVDEVLIDERPKLWQIGRIFSLLKTLNKRSFVFVYDLQTSTRSSFYIKLVRGRPGFSGIARRASHRHDTPERKKLHTIDRQKQQLSIAGIKRVPAMPTISWMKESIKSIKPEKPFMLIVPGGSSHRPEKRWPIEYYAHLCKWVVQNGHVPLLIGTASESKLLDHIVTRVPEAINLCDQTSIPQLSSLARKAVYAVGNDTGPMHVIAAARCDCTVIFSHASDPDLCAPRGPHVKILRERDLTKLLPDDVQNDIKLA